jgi:hypothetical protein
VSKRIALKVDCHDWSIAGCAANHKLTGAYPPPKACALCKERRPVIGGPALIEVVIDVDDRTATDFDGSHLWAEWYGRVAAFAGDAAAEEKWIFDRLLVAVKQSGCECSAHARTWFEENAIDYSSKETYFATGPAKMQNAVNRRLAKPEWDLIKQHARWSHRFDSRVAIPISECLS